MSSGRFSFFIVPRQKDGSFFAVKRGIKGQAGTFVQVLCRNSPPLDCIFWQKVTKRKFLENRRNRQAK